MSRPMPSIFRRLQKHQKEQRRTTKRLLKRARKEMRRVAKAARREPGSRRDDGAGSRPGPSASRRPERSPHPVICGS
jgi:hypothetical protein